MAQEVLEEVDVVYCGNCSIPVEYCRYNDKATYNDCLKWLTKKKQKSLLEKLLTIDDQLASDLEKLSLEDQKQNETEPQTTNEIKTDNEINANNNELSEENPHDPTKQPQKSILKKEKWSKNDEYDENEANSNNENSDNSDENETNANKMDDDPLLSQNFNRAIGIGRNVGRGGKGRRQKGRKGGKRGKKGKQGNDSDSEDNSQLSGKQLKQKQREQRRQQLAKDALIPDEEKQEQKKQEQKKLNQKLKSDSEMMKSKKIIVIGSKRIKGGKVVTIVTGLVELGMKPKRAQSEFRKQFATGVGVNQNDQGKTEVVIQGEHRYDLMKFLREKFGTPAKLLFYQTRKGLQAGFSPEGDQLPLVMIDGI